MGTADESEARQVTRKGEATLQLSIAPVVVKPLAPCQHVC
jgi:hypothetical protein